MMVLRPYHSYEAYESYQLYDIYQLYESYGVYNHSRRTAAITFEQYKIKGK